MHCFICHDVLCPPRLVLLPERDPDSSLFKMYYTLCFECNDQFCRVFGQGILRYLRSRRLRTTTRGF